MDSCHPVCGEKGYSNNKGETCFSDTRCTQYCAVDPTALTVTVSSSASIVTAQNPFSVTITFNKEIEALELSDITVTNATVSNLAATTPSKVYTADVTPSGDPVTITVSIPENKVKSDDGVDNSASNLFSIIYDSSLLTVGISSVRPDPTNQSPIPVSITFSEAVNGFSLSDLVVTNGTASNLNSSSNPVFTADITPTL